MFALLPCRKCYDAQKVCSWPQCYPKTKSQQNVPGINRARLWGTYFTAASNVWQVVSLYYLLESQQTRPQLCSAFLMSTLLLYSHHMLLPKGLKAKIACHGENGEQRFGKLRGMRYVSRCVNWPCIELNLLVVYTTIYYYVSRSQK